MRPNPIDFSKAKFVKSAVREADFPKIYIGKLPCPEIAFIGRSNAGKSSLINHLTHKKQLVHVSSTPGKTQLINFFSVDDRLLLVDLPGYGFAKVDRETRKTWGEILGNYLESRAPLKMLIILLDARRDLSQDDTMMIAWAKNQNKRLLFVFSKSDKLNRSEKAQAEKRLLASLSALLPDEPIEGLFYSVKDTHCRALLQNKISSLEPTNEGTYGPPQK